eukprot:Colp12_sorted_trinity150504_noHs@11639
MASKKDEIDDVDPHGHPRVPLRGHYTREKSDLRADWVEKFSGAKLTNVRHYEHDPEKLKGNIENFVGWGNIPIGIAGPLLINGTGIQGYTVCPYATTEGALVASATRGATALNRAGGVRARAYEQCMMRAPVFLLSTVDDAEKLERWILEHRSELQEQIKIVSKYAQLQSLVPFRNGNTLHLRFNYTTGDAAGQNMTTTGTWRACKWLLEEIKRQKLDIEVQDFYIEANLSGDKKVNYLNFIHTRGVRALAEVHIPEDVLQSVLKIDSATFMRCAYSMMQGAMTCGMVGFNINVANTVAAVFTATGQDIASVHESSVALLTVNPSPKGGIYACLVMPSVIIGTVGGGTALPTQKECLQMIGCYGNSRVARFAEILCSYALALDLSTLSAIASGQFANSHERLGKNRPDSGLLRKAMNDAFFQKVIEKKGELVSWRQAEVDSTASILSQLTSKELTKLVGHFAYEITYKPKGQDKTASYSVVVKAKPTDEETINMLNKLAQACGGRLAARYEMHKFNTGFKNCSMREIELCKLADPRITSVRPETLLTLLDADKEIFVIVMELLDSEKFMYMNTADVGTPWADEHVKTVLRDIANVHAVYLGKEGELTQKPWMEVPTKDQHIKLTALWSDLLEHNANEFPDLWTKDNKELASKFIASIPLFWDALEKAPLTLTHNDFNPRNVCLRRTTNGLKLCVYDWELAAVQVPQHDVAEFLSFILPPNTPLAVRHGYVEFYRQELEKASGKSFDKEEFFKIFDYANFDFAINRLGLYSMGHTVKDYKFLPRLIASHFAYLHQVAPARLAALNPAIKAKL